MFSEKRGYQLELVPALLGAAVDDQRPLDGQTAPRDPLNVANTGSGSANSGLDHEILKPGNHLSLRVGQKS